MKLTICDISLASEKPKVGQHHYSAILWDHDIIYGEEEVYINRDIAGERIVLSTQLSSGFENPSIDGIIEEDNRKCEVPKNTSDWKYYDGLVSKNRHTAKDARSIEDYEPKSRSRIYT